MIAHQIFYAYDLIGNRTSIALDTTTTTVAYEATNPLVSAVSYSYDRNGNTLSDDTYDAPDKTVGGVTADGTVPGFGYNGEWNRISGTVETARTYFMGRGR